MSNPEQRLLDNEIDLLTAVYIQMSRIYDLMYVIADASGVDKEKLAEIQKLHGAGNILTPPPALAAEEAADEPGPQIATE
jgi:hypothetical protein